MHRLLVFALLSVAVAAQDPGPWHLPPLDRHLPPRAEAIYGAMATRVDASVAMAAVQFMAPLWRLAGNPDYNASLDFIAARLATGGVTHRVVSYDNRGYGWAHRRGTLSIEGDAAGPVLSREQDRVALCINSFSTPPGGVTLPLIDVGAGAASDFTGKSVTGAVVIGQAPVGALWTRAVRDGGAAGVISTDLASYTRPADTPDVLQWGSIPYDEARRSFAFKASPRAARRLREAAIRTARVHVDIESVFHRGANRTVIADIPGRGTSPERVVLVAHVQEPGANDNASGAGTLLAAALAMQAAIAQGALPPPQRTITVLLSLIHI